MDRRTFLTRTAIVSVPVLAGCTGQQAGETGTPTATSTSTPTATSTPRDGQSAQEQYPDYNWNILEDVDPVETDTVKLNNTAFDPLVAAVKPGTEVTYTNEDSFGHTVTVPRLDVDEQLEGGESTTVRFEMAGTHHYVCTFHPPDMLGRMIVTEDLPTGTPTETPKDTPGETLTPTPTGTPADTPTGTPTETPTPTPNPSPTPTETDDGGYY